MTSYRRATPADADRIIKALEYSIDLCYKPTAQRIDLDSVTKYLERGANAYILNDDIFIWLEPEANTAGHTGKAILREHLLLRLNSGPTTFRQITDFMTLEAQRLDCAGIAVATGLSNRDVAMARAYQRQGFVTEAIVLYKPL